MHEVCVKLLCAEELGIELNQNFTQLLGDIRHQPVEVQVTGKKPTKKRKYKTVLRPSYRGDRKVRVPVETP